jgi:ribosomal protein S18 acetylase RimI-like enzyme
VIQQDGDVISIADLESLTARGWRGLEEEWLGDWLLRAADGFTGRANSALPIGDPGRPLATAVQEIRRWYTERGLPPMIAVSFPMDGPDDSAVDRYLNTQGWPLRQGPAVVMTAAPPAVAERAGTAAGAERTEAVSITAEPDDDWLAMYHYRGQELPPVARRLLMSAPWQAFGSVRRSGATIAIGRIAGDCDWAGLTAIETDPGHRRQGLATAVTAALAGLAADRDLTGLYLQVENENASARALYGGLGFADHHRYHYRVAPQT